MSAKIRRYNFLKVLGEGQVFSHKCLIKEKRQKCF